MIVAFYLEDMSLGKSLGEFFEDLQDFANSKFDIEISDEGTISIGNWQNPTRYRIGNNPKTEYTKEEALKDFIKSANFKAFAKSRFYTVYKTEQII